MARHVFVRGALLCATLLGTSVAAMAAPPAASRTGDTADLQAQVKDVDAKIAAARAHNAALQARMTQLEQQNSAQQKRMQQRDAEIAALQQKLQAAGGPAATASGGH